MNYGDREIIIESILSNEKEKTYAEMVFKGTDYYEKDFELYFLHMAYQALVGFMMEEAYEKCAVISKSINAFMKTANCPPKNSIAKIELINKFLKKHGK
jgi:hypothetical protein